MRFPTRQEVNRLRSLYPNGTRVELIVMAEEPRPVPPGTLGTVMGVEDDGSIEVDWDNGSTLRLLPDAGDRFWKV